MKKILFSILFTFGTVSLLFAGDNRIPGYLGKRIVLQYGLICNPSYYSSSGSDEYAYNSIVSGIYIPLQHNLSFDYVLTRRTMVGFEYGFSSMKPKVRYSDENEYPVSIHSNQLGVTYTIHKPTSKNPPAPLGRYCRLSLYEVFYNMADNFGYTALATNDEESLLLLKPVNVSGSYMGFGMAFGNRRIIMNKATLDYGWDIKISRWFTGVFTETKPIRFENSEERSKDVAADFLSKNTIIGVYLRAGGIL